MISMLKFCLDSHSTLRSMKMQISHLISNHPMTLQRNACLDNTVKDLVRFTLFTKYLSSHFTIFQYV